MTATKRRSGNPAKPAKAAYRPTVWHRHHRWGLFGIVAGTALTVLTGFLGPSAVTITIAEMPARGFTAAQPSAPVGSRR